MTRTNTQNDALDPLQKPHAAEHTDVTHALNVDPSKGLSLSSVESLSKRHAPNTLQSVKPRSGWRMLLDQFRSLVIGLLAVASVVSWATGDIGEAAAIATVLVLNALVGFATEWRAGRALDALRRQTRTTARVLRDGQQATLDAERLVPGDIVILGAGDRVPADVRLIEAAGLRTEESALTGESVPVNKTPSRVPLDAPLAEHTSMAYLGTTVVAGRGVAVVSGTGIHTELGRVGRLVAQAPDESTPLERRLRQLGQRLVYIVLAIAAVVFLTGWLHGDDPWVMIKVAISLAVAAVPEGLPAVTTLILALGVLRMARRKAIVRRLSAVETLGSTTIICADKTGTLTENRMTVREYRLADGAVSAIGEGTSLVANELLNRALRAGVLCSEAVLDAASRDGELAIGDPTETALLVAASRFGIDVTQLRRLHPKLDERPFDAASKRMITVHGSERSYLAVMKGAPAVVVEACRSYADGSPAPKEMDHQMRAHFLAVNQEMARQALRVLALAEKTLDQPEDSPDLESGYTFLGLVGMIDPPRAEVQEAIGQARAAGIRIVMLTGDQIHTARAVARELQLGGPVEPVAVHARELAGADHQRLAELARTAQVLARVSPEDKLRIVEALQQTDEVVAVTGDGVNDAPALKRADIGVAMGERGTEVAKEAADLVLADDNFATIVKAIEGGRTIYANIIKFVHMMFSHNLGEVLVIFVAIAVGWPLPLLPLQILWVNLVTDVFPAMALAAEPAAPGVMSHPPRSPKTSLLSRSFLLLILWQSAMLAVMTLAAYWWALGEHGEGAHARTVALMVLIGVQLGHMFNCRSRTRSAFEGLTTNPYIWVALFVVAVLQMLAIHFDPLSRVLGTVRLTGADLAIVLASVPAPVLVVEATKLFARRARRSHVETM